MWRIESWWMGSRGFRLEGADVDVDVDEEEEEG